MSAQYFSIRVLIYFLIVAGFFAIASQLAKTSSGLAVFEEHAFAEQIQLGCTILSGLLLIFAGTKHPQVRGALVLAGTLGLLAGIRELNNTELYRKIFVSGAASWIAGSVIFGFLFFKFRRGLIQQIGTLFRTPAAALLIAGVVIVTGWAQIFAQSSIFPSKEVDRIVEEGLESAGYLLIFCGVIELLFNLKSPDTKA